MNLKTIACAIALCGFCLNAASTDLGVLGAKPLVQMLDIAAPDVTFSTKYFFSLDQAATVSASANSLSLISSGQPMIGIVDLSLKLFDMSGTLMTSASFKDTSYRIDDFALIASNYYFQVSGLTTGLSGGRYVFAAVDSIPVNLVPEPSSLSLLGIGLLTMFAMHSRADRR